ncbi:MAG: hypothetical protein ACRD0K_18735 [Egibacteraceae bacterium]
MTVLAVERLNVAYSRGAWTVRGLTLRVGEGDASPSSASPAAARRRVAKAALGLLPAGTLVTGSVRIAGVEVVGAQPGVLRRLRGKTGGLRAAGSLRWRRPLALGGAPCR